MYVCLNCLSLFLMYFFCFQSDHHLHSQIFLSTAVPNTPIETMNRNIEKWPIGLPQSKLLASWKPVCIRRNVYITLPLYLPFYDSLVLVINLWCGTLLSAFENLNMLPSTELSLSVVAVISSKNSSRLVKHDLSCLNPCWLPLIKLCGFALLWTFHMRVPVFSPSKL